MINIAITDNHEIYRKGLLSTLTGIPDTKVLFSVAKGHELLKRMETSRPDIVLIDTQLSDENGIEICQRIKRSYPEVKVLVISSKEDPGYLAHILQIGLDGFLLKNIASTELREAIHTVNAAGFYINSFLAKSIRESLKSKKEKFLTAREIKILLLITEEFTTKEIAEKMYLSPKTVENYRNNIIKKTGVKNTAGLVAFAFKKGFVPV